MIKTTLLFTVLVLVSCIYGAVFNFAPGPNQNCAVAPFCSFDNPDNWDREQVPTDPNNDDVVIDFSAAKYTSIQYLNTQHNITVKSLTINGNGNSGLPDLTSCVTFNVGDNLVVNVTNKLTLNNAKIAIAGNDQESTIGQVVLSEGNFDGDDIFLNIQNVNSDSVSKFNVKGESVIGIFGDSVFQNRPQFSEHTNLIGGGNHTYQAGLNSQYRSIFSYATISGDSNIDALTITDGLVINNNAKVNVIGGAKFGGSASFDVMAGGSVLFSSSEYVYLENVNIDAGCFVNVSSPVNATSVNGDGTLFIQSCVSANIISSTFQQLLVYGNSSLNLINSAINTIANGAVQNDPNAGEDFNIFINCEGTVQVNAANLAHTTFTSIDGSTVTFSNPDAVYLVGESGLMITGTVTVNGPGTLNAGLFGVNLQDPEGKLNLVNGASIRGDLTNTRGVVTLNGNNGVYGTLTNLYGTIEVDYIGSTLTVTGNMTLNPESSIFFYNNVTTGTTSPITVSGVISLGNSTILIEFDEQTIQQNTNYILMQSEGSTNGQFGTVNSLNNGKLVSEQFRINVDLNPQQTFTVTSIEFHTEPLKPHKLAGWKVFLIVLSVLIVVGAGGFGFYKWKTTQGYIRIN